MEPLLPDVAMDAAGLAPRVLQVAMKNRQKVTLRLWLHKHLPLAHRHIVGGAVLDLGQIERKARGAELGNKALQAINLMLKGSSIDRTVCGSPDLGKS